METKPLLYGLIGFILGGLAVSIAAQSSNTTKTTDEVAMSEMTTSLKDKKGDDYDHLFINHMIMHHQAAVDMAKLSAENAKHEEIKQLSNEIINAQESEITLMEQWKKDWDYNSNSHKSH